MNKFPWILATALLCGCSSDWSAGLSDQRQAQRSGAAAAEGSAPAPAPASAPRAFARAPDLGSLVQYPSKPVVRQTGAYTWHAAQLSEEHALRATVDGELQFDSPDGRRITLDYVRHVEHPDGNWSWIGRGQGGEDTVITFGEHAVFGTIPQQDEPALRLTMADGISWVVSADPKQLAEIDNAATRPEVMDFFIPPKLGTAAGSGGMTVAGATAVPASTTGTTIIDVLVGYTVGFASNLGGDSAALTRVHNLVDITNQAYVNSQVNAQLRLVHSMSVNYADATKNGLGLEELTGFKAPSTQTTPAAAFAPLRQARETYGADLVVLVRRFQDPENEGCGIAWLIGGGRSGIAQRDEYFGYSVVSDGRDQGTDGKTYFCREETFAHELGHNMGSQHDRANAKKESGDVSYGAYDYSFGNKTDSATGNFYTVMAYGDSGQTRYRVFSNPRTTYCGGYACGVENQSDNARSLNQTVGTIASFRAQVVQGGQARTNDFDGDGKADVLWRNSASGANTIWRAASSSTEQAMTDVTNAAWKIAGIGDFNADGLADVLWRNSSTGANTIWRSGSAASGQAVTTLPVGAWNIAGVGDFNGDGFADILWRNSSTGSNTIWRSGRSATAQAVTSVPNMAWRIVGVGDFNGDGTADILWRNSSTGLNTIWRAGNSASEQAVTKVASLAWEVADTGDFNGDGRSDIVWRNNSTGANTIWLSASTAAEQAAATVGDQAWNIVAVGDYDGDGNSDLFWRNSETGANAIWRSGNASSQIPVSDVPNPAWEVHS